MKTYLIAKNENPLLQKINDGLKVNGANDVKIVAFEKITPEQIKESVADAEIVVASPTAFLYFSKEHMENMPKLKLISTLSVGTDWIDLKAARQRGIVVSNEKGVNSEAVAEHCFGMILDLAKRITEADRDIRHKKNYNPSDYMGINIYGRTLGIIGLGDIGKRVARIAKGFDMRVLGINKSKSDVPDVKLVNLETLLKESNIIAVTVPFNKETQNLLSQKEFGLMKKGVILVSITREKVIDKKVILDELDQGKVAGFGFDADITGQTPKDDPWLTRKRIVITPHSASMTEESEKGYVEMAIENIEAFLESKPIRIVN